MWPSTAAWLQVNSGFLSVTGALILFFSWVINNTIQARYTSLKSRIEQAERDNQLSYEFAGIRGSLFAVVYQTLKPEFPSRDHARSGELEAPYWEAMLRMARLRISSAQVHEFDRFCNREFAFSRSSPARSSAADEIGRIQSESQQLSKRQDDEFRRTNQVISEAHSARPLTETAVQRVVAAVDQCHAAIGNEINPKIAPLTKRLVEATNTRRREVNRELTRLRWRSKHFSRAAIVLYVLGSFGVLVGQTADKVLPKPIAAPNEPAQVSFAR